MNLAVSRILVPVDFSPHSELALRYAAALASRLEASVELLHVMDDRIGSPVWTSEVPVPDLSDLRKNVIADAEDQLERYRAVAELARVRTATTVRTGQPSKTIIEHARTGGIGLIVMGTHGRSGLAHLFMGSVAEHVVRHAPCPVVTMRDFATGDKTELTRMAQPATLGFALGHFGTSRE
jgi:nucleotide-binding universal stress UspA family protein